VDKEKFISFFKHDGNVINLKFSLKFLSELLYKVYNKKVIILIDEYDTPIISADQNKYHDEVIDFFKDFYSYAFKDNEHLQFAAITGIMRVAKDGIFSSLNNIDICTVLDEKFSNYFGFTEDDVNSALKEYELVDNTADVKKWYNGYKFGNYEISNPWAILNYLSRKKLSSYWIDTSGNGLVNEILDLSDEHIFKSLVDLLNSSGTKKSINENMTFDNPSFKANLWTLLLLSGYLTVEEKTEDETYLLKIPNKELYLFFSENKFHYFLYCQFN
jgi:hypothetical protein